MKKSTFSTSYLFNLVLTNSAIFGIIFGFIPKAFAETFQVQNNNDSGAGSLRQAIADASDKPGLDVVDLTLTRVSGTIALESPLALNPGNDIKFVDDGNTTISGQGRVQIMTIHRATVVISRLTFANGLAKGGDGVNGGGGGLGAGGALFISSEGADVTLNNVTFLSNRAVGGNGSSGGKGDGGDGGGWNGFAGASGGKDRDRSEGKPGVPGSDAKDFGGGGGGGGQGGPGRDYLRGVRVAGEGGKGGNGNFGGGGGGGGSHGDGPNSHRGGEFGKGGEFGGDGQTANDSNGGQGGGGAGLGGAIFIRAGSLRLFNCVFNDNSVAGGTGGNNGQGVAANIFNKDGDVQSNSVVNEIYGKIAQIPFPANYYEAKASIYSLSSSGTWRQAQAQAQSLGGNLVTIHDSTENNWLASTFSGVEPLWIGFTDEVTEEQFKWVSGETSTFTNWYSGEPNNSGGNQNYAVTNFKQPGKWDDQFGNDIHQGIIENKFYDFNGSKYLLSGTATWEQAQAQAESLGGRLVVINSQKEQDWLVSTFGNEQLWIGLTDRKKESEFKWVNGETPTFTNWFQGEPNNGSNGENYVGMNFGSSGKWNDYSGITSLRGIIEIPGYDAVGRNTDSQFFTLAKPTKFDVTARGGSGADIFQLESYDGLTTSQTVWGGYGSDIFNVSIESSSGIVGLDFNSGKLRKLAELLVEPDWDVREQRHAADISAASIGLGIDYAAAAASTLDITKLSEGAVSAIAATFHYANDIANIEANYALDLKEYQDNLAGIGDFFDNQGNRDWGTVDITQKRSLVEIMDFEPGIDIITLPQLSGGNSYQYIVITANNNSDDPIGVEVARNNKKNQANTFLRIHIHPNLLSIVRGQRVGIEQFIASLFVNNPTNSVIGKITRKVATTEPIYSGTMAGDYIYVAPNNPTKSNVNLQINGLDGDDVLVGRKNGGNQIDGGAGDDLIVPGTISDIIDGGAGYDQVNYSGWDKGISLKLPIAANGRIENIESIVGTRYDDTIDFSNLQNPPENGSAFNLEGGVGKDTLIGSPYQDVINGGEGSDNLDGGAGDDFLTGSAGTISGLEEIDKLKGGAGNDRFILGDETKAFYDDGNPLTPGNSNYADIIDFSPGDKIQLHGTSGNYRLVVVGSDTQILIGKPPEAEELIAIIRNQTNLNRNGSEFVYVEK